MSNLVGTCGFPSPFLSVLYFVTLYIISPQSSSIIHHPSCNISFVVFNYTYLYILLFCLLLFCILYYLLFIIYYNYIYIYTLYVYHLLCVVPSPTSTVVTEAWLTPRVTFASHGTISVLSMGRLGDSGDLGGNLQN